MSSYRNQTGLGLIEVMVSLFVLAVGLLGVAKLQLFSLSVGQNAYYTAQATNLAHSMIDRMRANRVTAKSTNAYFSHYGDLHAGSSDCSNRCTSAQIASRDLKLWKKELAGLLPKGQGRVELSGPATMRTVSVFIKYHDRIAEEGTSDGIISSDPVITRALL